MAPEIVKELNMGVRDLAEADLTRVDTFALGVTLINMLTGTYLFDSCLDPNYQKLFTDSSVLLDHLNSRLSPKMPQEELKDLSTLLHAMLHPDPQKRLTMT
jgi:serine/threonine protein kinase